LKREDKNMSDSGVEETSKAVQYIQNTVLYGIAAFFILFALLALSDSILAALIIAAAAVILPPIAVPQIPTRFRAVIAVVLFFWGVWHLGSAAQKKTVLENGKTAQTAQEMIKEADARAVADFQSNPDKILKDIAALIDAKNYMGAKLRLEPLLTTGDPRVNDLNDKAVVLAAAAEKVRQEVEAVSQKETEEKRQVESWTVSHSKSDMDDSPIILIYKDANAPVSAWLKEVKPSLNIRCKENETNVSFDADTNFTPVYGEYGRVSVRIRIDDGKAVSQLWFESTDGEAAFSPNAVGLLRQLQNAKTFRVEFNPYNGGLVTAEFDVRGLKPHLEEVAKTCHWNL
jgi:type VI secretion system protein VasI